MSLTFYFHSYFKSIWKKKIKDPKKCSFLKNVPPYVVASVYRFPQFFIFKFFSMGKKHPYSLYYLSHPLPSYYIYYKIIKVVFLIIKLYKNPYKKFLLIQKETFPVDRRWWFCWRWTLSLPLLTSAKSLSLCLFRLQHSTFFISLTHI